MWGKVKKIIIISIAALVLCVLILGCICVFFIIREEKYKRTQLLYEESPNGDYYLIISRVGRPDFPFGDDHLLVSLFSREDKEIPHYRVTFFADVANDGGEGWYEYKWLDDGVWIKLDGSEQPAAYYILPFPSEE